MSKQKWNVVGKAARHRQKADQDIRLRQVGNPVLINVVVEEYSLNFRRARHYVDFCVVSATCAPNQNK